MGVMNDIKGDGHSLTAPRLTGGWVIFAVVAIALLLAVFGAATWLYGKAKSATGMAGKLSGSLEGQSVQGGGSGWL